MYYLGAVHHAPPGPAATTHTIEVIGASSPRLLPIPSNLKGIRILTSHSIMNHDNNTRCKAEHNPIGWGRESVPNLLRSARPSGWARAVGF